MSVESYIKNNVKSIGEKVFVVPEIPEKKLNNAIMSIAPNVEPEYVLAILDSTVFGSAKEGFLFTGDTVYKKYSFEDRGEYRFEDIKKAEYKVVKTVKDNGKVEEKDHIYLHFKDDTVVEVSTSYLLNLDYKCFVDFVNAVISEAGDDESYTKTSQLLPLASMDEEIKEAYVKIMANFAYADDKMIDSKEYAEIMSLIVRVDINKETRIKLRGYMCDADNIDDIESLLMYLLENVPEGSLDVIKKSIVKDIIYIFKLKNDINSWESNDFIVSLKERLAIEDKHIELIIEAIINDEEILSKRKNDSEIKKSMKDLAAKAGAVGVPLAAIYFSGSIVGMSAAGITSGLATIGMGGVLGFSSMVTGVGVVVLLGVGTYKGIKKLTGVGELENNKQRELMLQAIIKNAQKSLDYLIEDVNEISRLLTEEIKNGLVAEKKIEKLSSLLSMMSTGAKATSNKISYAESETVMAQLPKTLDMVRLDELTKEPTKQKHKELILSCYSENTYINAEGKEVVEYVLSENLSLKHLESLSVIFKAIGYTNVADAALASAKGAVKNLTKNIFGN